VDFDRGFFNLGALDALSYRDSPVHRLDPRVKVLVTCIFVVTVVSFPKYEIARLIPFFLFPVVVFALGGIPARLLLKKIFVASVFALFLGFFNPLFDTRPMYYIFSIPVSGGWISFLSIMVKFFLTMSAVLLLVSTTSFPGIAYALRRLGIPEVLTSQLLFLYRYLFVLMEETMRTVRARNLRSFGRRGEGWRVFASLTGTLFVRTIERAERIYNAMLSRGFAGTIYPTQRYALRAADLASLVTATALLLFFRTFNLVEVVGRQVGRVL
jgi:cobalt/nickel transport system permease protein